MSGEPWIALSVKSKRHPKVAPLSDAAYRVWIASLLYCREYTTDGVVTPDKIRDLMAEVTTCRRPAKLIDELCALGRWVAKPGGGWSVRNYASWQQTREEIRADSTGAAGRMRAKRARDAAKGVAEPPPPPRAPLESGVFPSENAAITAGKSAENPEKIAEFSAENLGKSCPTKNVPHAVFGSKAASVTGVTSRAPSREPASDLRSLDRESREEEIQSPPLPPAVPAESSAGARGPGGGGGLPVEGSKPVGPTPGHGGAVPAQTAAGRPGAYPPAGEGRQGAPTADPAPLLAGSLGPSAAAILAALEACPALAEIARPALAQQLAAHVDGGSKRLSWVLAAIAKAGKTAATDNATDQPMPARTLGRFVEGAVARCGDPAQTAVAKPGGAAPWRPGGGAPYHAPPKTKMSA